MAKRGHGEGTIYKRKDGRWEAKASIGYDPATGKLKRLTRYFQTRKEAQEWLAQVQHEKKPGSGKPCHLPEPLIFLVEARGLEPPTSRVRF